MSQPSEYQLHRNSSRRALAVVVTILSYVVAAQSSEHKQHFSTREGTIIRMHPLGASFEIPQHWTARTQESQLKQVRRGEGEWNTEYAKVVNAALPFSRCVAQAGRWDWNASTYGGVTVRAYVLDQTFGEVVERISGKGLAATQALPRTTISNVSITESNLEQWRRILINYDAWYYDYGGRANLDFYVAERNGTTIVLVFMYGGIGDPGNGFVRQQILGSFSW